MNKKFNLENYYKQTINSTPHTFNEGLWNKLDTQLVPIREAYNKKEKRRVFILWSSLILIGGTAAVFFGTTNKKNSIKQFATVLHHTKVSVIENKSNAITLNDTKNNRVVSFEPIDHNFIGNIHYDNNIHNLDVEIVNNSSQSNISNNKTINIKNNHNANTEQKEVFVSESKDVKTEDEVVENNHTKKDIVEDDKNTIEANKVENKEKEKVENIVVQKKEEKQKVINKPSEIYAIAGFNSATPIKKPGYFAGVMLEKQIEDKRIFVGVKVSQSSLNHELVSANKANIFPLVTDAVIEKVTTIQMPFGYQFYLNKKAGEKSSMLNLGFEPTLLTGVTTIYYDDNGIVGGPRTAVMNSAILKNAVNKFNVSFIAGLKLPINNKLFFSVGAGYGLINITDKQYYNRSIKNNNLKYIQAGFLLKLK